MLFSEKLKKYRKIVGLSQDGLARAIGVSRQTLMKYENGSTHPSDRNVYFKLAKIFGVDVGFLLSDDEEFLTAAAESYGLRGQAQARLILEQTSALFAGGELSEKDQLAFQLEMQQLFFESKEMARAKFTPKKYRAENNGGEG